MSDFNGSLPKEARVRAGSAGPGGEEGGGVCGVCLTFASPLLRYRLEFQSISCRSYTAHHFTQPSMSSSTRVIIVTGASSGLGRAIATELASHPTTRVVICVDLTPDALSNVQEARSTVDEIRTSYGADKAIFARADVSNAADMEQLIQTAVSSFDRLDVLVNNAGVALESYNKRGPRPVHETDQDTFEITMDVNAKSVFLGCKYAVEQFRKQDLDAAGNRGFIVNISSIYGMTGADGHGESTRRLCVC